jgi:hypothetical protein
MIFLRLKIKKKTFRWAKIQNRSSIYFNVLFYSNPLLKIPLQIEQLAD